LIGNHESLRCDTRLSGVDGTRFDCGAQRALEICARHHDKRVIAAELKYGFLDLARSRTCHGASCFLAPRQRDRGHARVDNYSFGLLRLNQQCLESALVESGAAEDSSIASALRNIRSVLQQSNVRH
jgi:hypothetical protein